MIRKAKMTDLENIITLNYGLIDYHAKLDGIYKPSDELMGEIRENLESYFGSSKDAIFVAEVESQLIGFISVSIASDNFINPKKIARIKHFFVIEKYRGEKYGRKLFEASKDYLKDIGVNYLEVAINSENTIPIDIYKKFGFKNYVLVFNQEI